MDVQDKPRGITSASLTGETVGGKQIQDSDSVKAVGCK